MSELTEERLSDLETHAKIENDLDLAALVAEVRRLRADLASTEQYAKRWRLAWWRDNGSRSNQGEK